MQQLQTSSEICFEITAQIIAADEKKKENSYDHFFHSVVITAGNKAEILTERTVAQYYPLDSELQTHTSIYKSIKIFLFKIWVLWVQLKRSQQCPGY